MSWKALETNQPHVAKMIVNSIRKGRVAHAYLFEGQRGQGKRSGSFIR